MYYFLTLSAVICTVTVKFRRYILIKYYLPVFKNLTELIVKHWCNYPSLLSLYLRLCPLFQGPVEIKQNEISDLHTDFPNSVWQPTQPSVCQ